MINRVLKSQLLTTLGARGLAAGGTFLLSYVLATFVSIQSFGAFMLCLSIMIGMQVFASLGTDRATLKYMGVATSNNNRQEVAWIYKHAMTVNVLVGVLLGVVLWILAPSVARMLLSSTEHAVDSLRITALLSPLYSVIYLCNFLMKGWGKANVSCLFEIGCISIVLSGVVIICAWLGIPLGARALISALGVILVVYLLVALWAVWWLYRRSTLVESESVSFSQDFYRHLPDFLLVGIIFYYTQWGVGLVLGAFHSESDVALFSLGLRLAMIIGFILTVYDSILGPRFSRLQHEGNGEGLKQLAQKSAFQMTCFALLPALVFIIWPEAVLALFGSDYSGAAGVVRILVIGQLVNVMTGSVILLLLMADQQRAARNILIWSVVVGGVASLVLIPRYSAEGAAYALLLCLLIQNVVAVYVVKKKFGFLMTDWRFVIAPRNRA
ncbi:polysaccharide biosynthesis C-terminal domain-containing protein [Vreelandella alkaliphila]|uniref:polysaccharide biosynthesis C-terminal domain-containing protein n=1 Tax=Vreelandella alkaliphila TaxID=272774 RepID=UPI0039F5BB9B